MNRQFVWFYSLPGQADFSVCRFLSSVFPGSRAGLQLRSSCSSPLLLASAVECEGHPGPSASLLSPSLHLECVASVCAALPLGPEIRRKNPTSDFSLKKCKDWDVMIIWLYFRKMKVKALKYLGLYRAAAIGDKMI